MANPTSCTPEKLLAGFAALSPEDQERVRAELLKGAGAHPEQVCCDPAAMLEQMMAELKETGGDPIAMCKKMMGKKLPGRSFPTPSC